MLDLLMTPCSVFVWLAFGYAGGLVAARKGYSIKWGIILAILFGPIAIFIAAILPSTAEGRDQELYEQKINAEAEEALKRRTCAKCGREVAGTSPVCPRCNTRFT